MDRRKSPLRSWCAIGSACAVLAAGLPGAQAGTNPLVGEAKPARGRLAVKVAPGNWGTANAGDVQSLLEAVAAEFQRFAAAPAGDSGNPVGLGSLAIRVVPRHGSPRVLYERGPQGEYVVHLSARNENWFQYAYQFSHELCHIFSRFDHKERNGHELATANQWFEEALCETASLFTLASLAESWEQSPPAPRWAGEARNLRRFFEHLIAEGHRQLPPQAPLSHWLRENEAELRQNPYLREKNEVLANLLLPLFSSDPQNWDALGYLNLNPADARCTLEDYLRNWYDNAPPEHKHFVASVLALLWKHDAPPAVAEVVASTAPASGTKLVVAATGPTLR